MSELVPSYEVLYPTDDGSVEPDTLAATAEMAEQDGLLLEDVRSYQHFVGVETFHEFAKGFRITRRYSGDYQWELSRTAVTWAFTGLTSPKAGRSTPLRGGPSEIGLVVSDRQELGLPALDEQKWRWPPNRVAERGLDKVIQMEGLIRLGLNIPKLLYGYGEERGQFLRALSKKLDRQCQNPTAARPKSGRSGGQLKPDEPISLR